MRTRLEKNKRCVLQEIKNLHLSHMELNSQLQMTEPRRERCEWKDVKNFKIAKILLIFFSMLSTLLKSVCLSPQFHCPLLSPSSSSSGKMSENLVKQVHYDLWFIRCSRKLEKGFHVLDREKMRISEDFSIFISRGLTDFFFLLIATRSREICNSIFISHNPMNRTHSEHENVTQKHPMSCERLINI